MSKTRKAPCAVIVDSITAEDQKTSSIDITKTSNEDSTSKITLKITIAEFEISALQSLIYGENAVEEMTSFNFNGDNQQAILSRAQNGEKYIFLTYIDPVTKLTMVKLDLKEFRDDFGKSYNTALETITEWHQKKLSNLQDTKI